MREIRVRRRNQLLDYLNLLTPTGHVMHQQFNIQQLYVLSTLYLCVLYLSENKQKRLKNKTDVAQISGSTLY